ncbi:MAG TPA: hypothetical protein VG942_04120 [Hyphomonadaceae bacterium]|nr:hypothetical protein [Hyphomonadaceae bacterium]
MLRFLYFVPYASLAAVLGLALYGLAISVQADPEEILHPFARFCPDAVSELETKCTLALYEDLSGLKPLQASGEDSIRVWYVGTSILSWSAYWSADTITSSEISRRSLHRPQSGWFRSDETIRTARGAELIALLPALKILSQDPASECDPAFDGGKMIVEGVYRGAYFYSEPTDSAGCTDPRLEPIRKLRALLSEIQS